MGILEKQMGTTIFSHWDSGFRTVLGSRVQSCGLRVFRLRSLLVLFGYLSQSRSRVCLACGVAFVIL